MTNLKPLYSNCRDCRNNPAYQTRQRAIGAAAGKWYSVCEKHKPGSALPKLADTRPELAARLAAMKAHEIEPIHAEA